MQKLSLISLLLIIIFLTGCDASKNNDSTTFISQLSDAENIEGTNEYINSPYVTAGNRVYMVGHQDGSFPDLGWHITGEMGGIWDHPIKLMDGFRYNF